MDMIKSEHLSCSDNNSQMNSKITQSKQKKSPTSNNKQRRSRCDNLKREHLCGCGKGYLSAAALYTHVKQKHDGVTPLGSVMPSAANERSINKKEAFEFCEDKSQADKQLQFEKNCPDFIYQEICAFVMRFYPSTTSSQESFEWISAELPRQIFLRTQDFEGVLNSLEDLSKRLTFQQSAYLPHQVPSTSTGKSETQFIGKQHYEEDACFSDSGVSANHSTKLASNQDKQSCLKKVASEDQNDIDNNNHNDLNKNISQFEEGQDQPYFMQDGYLPNSEWNLDFYDFQRELRITSIDNIFAIFIANLNSKLCKEAVLEVVMFLILLRKILNDCGEEICSSQLPLWNSQNEQNEFQCNIKIEDNDKEDSNEQKGEFCATNCGQNLAEIANVFVSKCQEELFKHTFVEEGWSKNFKFLGETDEGLKNMCLLLRLLIHWMNVFKFADSILEFNQEEEEKDEDLSEQSKKQLKSNQDCSQINQQEKKPDGETCETGDKGVEEGSIQENSRKIDFDEDPMLRDEQEGQLEEQAMLANLSSGLSLTKPSGSSSHSYQSSYGNIIQNSNKLSNSIYDQNSNFSLNSNLSFNGYNPQSTSFYNQRSINPFVFNNYFKSNRNSNSFASQEQLMKMNKYGYFQETPRSLSSAPFFKPSQFAFYNSITPTAAGSALYPSGYALCSSYAALPFNSNTPFELNLMQQSQLQQLQILNSQQSQQYSKQQGNLDMLESSFA